MAVAREGGTAVVVTEQSSSREDWLPHLTHLARVSTVTCVLGGSVSLLGILALVLLAPIPESEISLRVKGVAICLLVIPWLLVMLKKGARRSQIANHLETLRARPDGSVVPNQLASIYEKLSL